MSTTTSKLGKKYDRKEIEKLDKQFHSEMEYILTVRYMVYLVVTTVPYTVTTLLS